MEIIPGILASIVTLILSVLAYLQYRGRRRDGLASKSEEIARQRTRALYWYMENFHKIRRAVIDKGDPSILEGIPFEPPEHVLKGEKMEEEK